MVHQELLKLLESVLGRGKPTSRDNIAFKSPFVSHQKNKLEIDLDSTLTDHPWHCWVSDKKGKNLFTLLRLIHAPSEVVRKIDVILNRTGLSKYDSIEEKTRWDELTLPTAFKPLWEWAMKKGGDIRDPLIKNALYYLRKRGIDVYDIIRYNIGYCDTGTHSGRVIIPSYDAQGKLNYFVARTFIDKGLAYKNPKVSKDDVIIFESFVSWNLPVTIVEGVFDAIAVRFNAIPLLGKSMSKSVRHALVVNGVERVNVCLDSDAKTNALHIVQDLQSYGIDAKYIPLSKNGKKDPSELGFEKITEILHQSPETSFATLIYSKLMS